MLTDSSVLHMLLNFIQSTYDTPDYRSWIPAKGDNFLTGSIRRLYGKLRTLSFLLNCLLTRVVANEFCLYLQVNWEETSNRYCTIYFNI